MTTVFLSSQWPRQSIFYCFSSRRYDAEFLQTDKISNDLWPFTFHEQTNNTEKKFSIFFSIAATKCSGNRRAGSWFPHAWGIKYTAECWPLWCLFQRNASIEWKGGHTIYYVVIVYLGYVRLYSWDSLIRFYGGMGMYLSVLLEDTIMHMVVQTTQWTLGESR